MVMEPRGSRMKRNGVESAMVIDKVDSIDKVTISRNKISTSVKLLKLDLAKISPKGNHDPKVNGVQNHHHPSYN